MAKTFASGSSLRMDSINTTLGNWEYTQAWSVAFRHKPSGNNSGAVLGRETDATIRGWLVRTRAGASTTQYAAEVSNTGALGANVTTVNEFATSAWHSVVITYSGSGTAAGFTIYVDSTSAQSKTTLGDTLAGNTIINTTVAMIGARGTTAAPAFFLSGDLSRVCLYNAVLSAGDIAILIAGTGVPTSNLLLWQELSDLGARLQPDWSENGNTFAPNFAQGWLAGPTADLYPPVGTSGVKTLSGPLIRVASPPMLQNLGWAGGANAGVADQLGPGVIVKAGEGYRGFFENDTGAKSLDTGNQPGAFDFDTPTLLATSPDGSRWTIPTQNVPASAIFSCNNLSGDATFKAAVRAETSISSMLWDPDDAVWKCWFHGGNNSGTRKIYYATCSGDPRVAGNWVVQNGGVAVISNGSGTDPDATWVADASVVRVSSSLMYCIYRGVNGSAVKLCAAKSTDRGLTWTKLGVAVDVGTSDQWDSGNIAAGGFAYDAPTATYIAWYGAYRTGGTPDEGVGFAYTTTPETVPYTKGLFNPVFCGQHRASATNNLEYLVASTIGLYVDANRYRLMMRADNGVSGTTAFRGRIEAYLDRIVNAASLQLVGPVDQYVEVGGSATFTIGAMRSAAETPTYQWQLNYANVGTNSPTYTLSPVTSAHQRAIVTCLVTDSEGTTSSREARVLLNPAPVYLWDTGIT